MTLERSEGQAAAVAFHIVGDAFVDLFSFLEGDWPEKGGDARLTQPIQTFAGGSATNTATHVNALLRYFDAEDHIDPFYNNSMVLHTTLNPDDHYGKILLSHAQQHGYSLENCKSPEDTAATGHCVAIVAGQERSFMTFRGCVDSFQASQWDVDRIVDAQSHIHVHIAGFFNLSGFQNGAIAAQIKRLRQERRQKSPEYSTVVSLVPQHDASKQWDGGIDELATCLDFLIMNELEAKYIMEQGRLRKGQTPPSSSESLLNYDLVQDCATYFGEVCPQACIVLTRGPSGAVALLNGRVTCQQSTVQVKPIDPTGAGDSFSAGFLHGLWAWSKKQTQSEQDLADVVDGVNSYPWPTPAIQHALRWGCAMGTAAVLIQGASIPSKKEHVLQFYSQIEKLQQRD
jgi:sugar/nucleoside kinase (ribokinase family)